MIKPIIVQNNIGKSPQFASYFFLIIPLTIFQVYYALFDAYNNALYRSSYGVFLRDFVQRILVLIGLLLVFLHVFDFNEYIYYYVISICLPTLLIFLHIIRHKALDLKINLNFLKKPLVASMVSVSFFGLLNSFSSIAVLQIDAIMVNSYMDSAAVGVYVISFYFGTLVFIPAKALNKIAPTLIAKAYKENNRDTIKEIYYKSCGNLFLVGVLILLGLMVNLDNVFNIIPRSYEEGKTVIVLIGFAYLIKMAGGSNDSVINYSKYYKINTTLLILFGLLIVSLNFIFIPMYGMTGAALASLLALFFHNMIKTVFIKWKFGLNPYNFQYLIVLVISVIIYFIVSYIPKPENFIFEIFIDSLVTTVLFYFSIKFSPLAKDLNKAINQLQHKVVELFKTKFK
jgi:O-antigen/teichoic acid export membrane protein